MCSRKSRDSSTKSVEWEPGLVNVWYNTILRILLILDFCFVLYNWNVSIVQYWEFNYSQYKFTISVFSSQYWYQYCVSAYQHNSSIFDFFGDLSCIISMFKSVRIENQNWRYFVNKFIVWILIHGNSVLYTKISISTDSKYWSIILIVQYLWILRYCVLCFVL